MTCTVETLRRRPELVFGASAPAHTRRKAGTLLVVAALFSVLLLPETAVGQSGPPQDRRPYKAEFLDPYLGDGKVELRWRHSALRTNITDYHYEYLIYDNPLPPGASPWEREDWKDIPGCDLNENCINVTSYVVTGLTNGQLYRFRVRAVNVRGTGLPSEEIRGVPAALPATLPGVTGLEHVVDRNRVRFFWNRSAVGVGNDLSYVYQRGNQNAVDIGGSNAGTRGFALDLLPGTYTISIRAKNSNNNQLGTARTRTITVQGPDAPKGLRAEVEDREVTLRWTQTTDNLVGAYEYLVVGSNRDWEYRGGRTPELRITRGLTNGQEYTFRLRGLGNLLAVSGTPEYDYGYGPFAEVTATPNPVLPAPADLELKPGTQLGTSFTVQWTAVPDATGYVATAMSDGKSVSGTVTDTEAEFTGLSINTIYTVLVHATADDTNYHPTGRTARLRVSTNLPPPSQPNSLVIEAVNTDVTLRWAQSTDASIMRYEYRYRTGETFTDPWVAIPNSDATTASHTVTGLANNTEYFFALRAVNLAGGGASSNARVVIRTVPAAPAGLMAEARNQEVLLSWTQARDRSITRYEYTRDGGTNWVLISTSFDEADVLLTGLDNGRTYTFQVRAVNAQGNGLASVVVMATPEGVPGEPRVLTADLADSQDMATLRWQAPSSGGRVFRYELRVNGSDWMVIPGGAATRSYVVTGFDEARNYSLYVRAANEIFAGDAVSVNVRTLSVPAAPPDLALKGGTLENTSFTVQWTSGLGALEDYIGPDGDGTNSYSATATPFGGGTAVTGTVTKTGSGGSAMYEAAFTGLSANTFYIVLVHAIGDGEFDAPRGRAATVGVLTTGPLPALSVADASVDEGDSGSANMEFTVTLSKMSSEQVTVDYATADGTATLANADYTMTSGTLTFAASTTSQIITVRVTGDETYEDSETFTVTLSNPSSNAARAYWRATGTITNDEAPPTLSIADARVDEGDRGTTNMEFTVTLSETSGEPVTVDYATADGTATANADYTVTNGTLTFAVGGPTTQTFNVSITGDGTYEPDETFTVVLRHPSGAMLSDATATGTISNDEAQPTLSLTPSNVSLLEGTGTARFSQQFQVTLSRYGSQRVTVDYTTADGTATAGRDYIGASGTMTFFLGGITRKSFYVEIIADEFYENNEAFTVNLSNPIGSDAALSTTERAATITIRDDDPQPSLRIADASVVEGNSGTVTMEFTVTLLGAIERQMTVDYATEDGTATVANADYTAVNDTLTFAGGVAMQTVTVNVPITGDEIYERDETLRVTLTPSSQSDVRLRRRSATGTITNDEAPPIFSIADASVTEGNSGTTDMEFTVTMNLASSLELTVGYATAGGTATEGTDYTATAGILTFAAGETSKIFTVQITGDLSAEADETFTVALRNTTGRDARLSKTARRATGTIRSDDAPPTLSIADASVTEGNSGTTGMEFTVTLGEANDQQVTVEYATADGTATLNTDYTATSGVLTFATGTLTQTFTVLITGDETYEANETFTVALRNPANVAISTTEGTATGTINNDDDPPVLSIADASVTEGDSDTTMRFTVRLSAASVLQATVNYTTAGGGNATVGTDYTTVNGVLTFTPGVVTQTFNVPITGDQVYELAETFTVTISAPTGATLGDATATGTINNDESAPILSFAPSRVSVPEGDSGSVSQMLTVTMSLASSQQVTVDYETAGGTGANAATANTDYTRTSGTLTFAPGNTSKTFTVEVAGDVIDENNETFTIRLSDASGSDASVSATSGTATVTITDNEGPPTLNIADASVTEGNSDTTDMEFTVTLSAVSGLRVTVAYATADGTATVGDRDYSTTRRTLTFDAGELTQTFTVPVLGDLTYEPDETFTVTLSNPSSNAELGDATATGTINNDEEALVLRIEPTSLSVTEGNSGSVLRTFAVAMNFASSQRVTVNYATADGSGADAATAGRDYTTARGTLTFLPGQSRRNFAVRITGDVIDEPDETFTVTLSDASGSNASISSTAMTATVTIVDNDNPPALSIADVSRNEADSGEANLVFTVRLSVASGRQVTVNHTTADGSATAGTDYESTSGTLTFAAGETTKTINVPITGDEVYEENETFTVTLSGQVNATLSDGEATGTINNDEEAPTLRIAPLRVSVTEGGSGATPQQIFTVTMSPASGQQVTVRYATVGGSSANAAIANTDYTATSGILTFSPGDTSKIFTVQVLGDTLNERDETFSVRLSDVSDSNISISTASTATVTIEDDDAQPSLSIADVSREEGNSGSANMEFTVTLSAVSGLPVIVRYATANGIGADAATTADRDYVSGRGNLTFAAGTNTQTIRVSIIGDVIYEEDETFTVTLSNPTNATLADGVATGTISNDEAPLALSITPNRVSVAEGDRGDTARRIFTVAMNLASDRRVTVRYATADGTGTDAATDGRDYTGTSGTLTFTAGQTSRTITVQVTGDVIEEGDEIFTVALSDATGSNASISSTAGTATITIEDNEGPPTLRIADASENEGSGNDLVFVVTLAPASSQQVTVNYATTSGTASAPADYTTTSGVLTFTSGTTRRTFSVPIIGDGIHEVDETLTVALSDSVNADISTVAGTATGTIVDDEAPPVLSFTPSRVSVPEGDSGSTSQTFTVTMSLSSSQRVTVRYATADGTGADPATADRDYTATSGTLTFAPGETSETFVVQVAGDTLDENNKTFTVGLSDVSGEANISAAGTATVTIADDDDPPTLSLSNASAAEGASGDRANMEFAVAMSAVSGLQVTVAYATANGNATAGADYVRTTGILTFAAGTDTQTIRVPIIGDGIYEQDETFTIALSNPVNAAILTAAGTATGTITDDEDPPTLSIAPGNVSVREGNSGPTARTFTVAMSLASSQRVTVAYATADGTAIAGTDYAEATGTLTFVAGETSKPITVRVTGDRRDENDEAFTITLSNASGSDASISTTDRTATVTITDDDNPPTLRIANASVVEGGNGASTGMEFTVTLSVASGLQVTVGYTTADGTATVTDADYTATDGILTFVAGTTTQTISVPIIGDVIYEGDETFTVTLSNPSNAALADREATGAITEDENPPTLSIAPSITSVTEGGSGATTPQTFTVAMSLANSRPVTVDYATADGTAIEGRDYVEATGTLTFARSETSKTVTVQIIGDVIDENAETFTIALSRASDSSGTNVGISPAARTGTITITDDDDPPTLSIANASAAEGGRGASGNMEFTVTMSTESGLPVTVGYTTANGSATAGEDYRSASATLRFAAGTTMQTFRVPLIGDAIYEGDEAFTVALSNPSNATLADGEATGTITEDESPPILSITPSNSSVTEGGSGATPQRTFTVAMSLASSERVIVNYATVEGTGADAATEDTDYTATSGILTFAADETRKTVTVQVIGDVFDENDETFTVALSDVSGSSASISTTAGTATVTIEDDDASPRLSIADASIGEGNAGTANMDFTVTLSAVSGLRVTVAYATADGTGADAATEDADYTAADGVLTFTAGTTVQTIRVPINGDEIYEGDESFTVVLSNPTNAVLADLRATGMIINDEASLTLSLTPGNLSVAEGDSGSAPQIFTVSMNLASSRQVTVNYATADGTAVEGTDYTEASGALAFAPGETSQTFTVQVAGDVLHEGNEIFTVALSDVSGFGASISSTAGTATITVEDNEDPPDVSIAGASGGEGDSGTANLEFMVTLTLASGQQVTVDYATADGAGVDAAIAGTDYTTTSGTLTFVAGETAQILNVPIIGDVIYETDETFTVTLSGPSVGSVLGSATVTGTITDDENEPTLSIAPSRVSVIEDGSGTTAQTFFTVNLAPASSRQVTVNYATADGSGAGAAIAGRDYSTATGTLTFAPGDSNKTFTVEIIGDDDENIENFTVRLSDASGLDTSISTTAGTATVTIAELPVLSIADVSTDEGDSGNTPLVFTVSLTPASIEAVTVAYAATAVTATADADYTVVDGTLTFAASETTQTFTALIIGDNVFEPDESFTVTLSNPSSNAKILAPGATATGTITNDEAVPGLSIEDATAEESDGMVFIVTLDPVSSEEVTVAYATADSTGANPATAGADYTATSGTLIFEPGQASRTITVQITEDGFDDDEEDETFVVTLSSPSGATLADGTATGTIRAIDRPAIQEIGIQPPYFSDGYRGGEQIEVVVDFDIPVRYDENNPPSIALTFGDSSTSPPTISEDLYRNVAAQETDSIRRAFAYKVSNNGDTDRREGNSDNVDNDVVHFLYRVQPDDLDPDGIGIGENSLEGDIFPLETDKPVPFRNEHDEVMPTQELQVDGSKPFRPGQLFEDLVEEVESRSALAIIDDVARTISQRIRETGTSEQMAFSIASYEIGSISQAQKGLSRLLDPAKLGEGGTYKDIKPTMEQLFDGTSFVIPLQLSAGAADAAQMEIWGRGSWQSMDGDDDRFDWDGTRRGAQLGMDARFHEKLLAGLVVSWSDGGFGYKDGRGEIKLDGSYDNRMLSVHPWMAWSTDEGLDLWASVGYGEGEFTIGDVNFDDITSDTTLQTVAAGASGPLLKQNALTIMLKGEGFLAKVDVDDGNISDVDANRVRLAAEGSWAHATDSGGRLTPSLELGLRLDGGDYSSGAGAEIGAGIMFVDHSDRLSLDLDGRFLVTDSDVLERGVSGVLRYTPNSAGRGLSFDMRSDWGASSSGMERLWESGASDMAENGLQAMLGARMQAEIGYGIGYASGLLKSYGGVELEGGGNARYFIGSRYTTPSLLELSFEGAHRTTDSESDPASSITLRGTLRW